MTDDNVTRFPISSYERRKNEIGPLKVECIISDRLLSFHSEATPLQLGTVVWVDVLSMPEDDEDVKPRKARKLCSLALTIEDLQRALDAVKVVDAPPR